MSIMENETKSSIKRGVPEGLWIKCPGCSETIYRKELDRNLNVCPKCSYHMYVSAQERMGLPMLLCVAQG